MKWNNSSVKTRFWHRFSLKDSRWRIEGCVLADIALKWCKFLSKSEVNQVSYIWLIWSKSGASGTPRVWSPWVAGFIPCWVVNPALQGNYLFIWLVKMSFFFNNLYFFAGWPIKSHVKTSHWGHFHLFLNPKIPFSLIKWQQSPNAVWLFPLLQNHLPLGTLSKRVDFLFLVPCSYGRMRWYSFVDNSQNRGLYMELQAQFGLLGSIFFVVVVRLQDIDRGFLQ